MEEGQRRKVCRNVAQNTDEKRLSWYLLPQTLCMKRTLHGLLFCSEASIRLFVPAYSLHWCSNAQQKGTL